MGDEGASVASDNNRNSPPTTKRPARKSRPLAAAACNNCRTRKVRCDEARPTCSACQHRKVPCIYDHTPTDGESRQQAVRRELSLTRQRLDDMSSVLNSSQNVSKSDLLKFLDFIKTDKDPFAPLPALVSNSISDTASLLADISPDVIIDQAVVYPALHPVAESALIASGFQGQSLEERPGILHSAIPDSMLGSMMSPSHSVEPSDDRRLSSATDDHRWRSPQIPVVQLQPPRSLCDKRLYFLDISQWTNVAVTSEHAANIISLYLETDHPILGFFDAALFVTGICGSYPDYCSSFLVSSLLYFASHAYTAFDSNTVFLRADFAQEAQSTFSEVQGEDSALTVAGCMILSLSFAVDGNDVLSGVFKAQGQAMGQRLQLFDVTKSNEEIAEDDASAANDYLHRAHIAWGAFNWLCLHASYYNEQPVTVAPSFHIPSTSTEYGAMYLGNTFQAVCKFRSIFAEVVAAYNAESKSPVAERVPSSFPQRKYQELLFFADRLALTERRRPLMPHHVMVLHIWLHTAIIDVWRPFTSKNLDVQGHGEDRSPELICHMSLSQLKSLVVEYRTQPSASYSILWHLSLLYLGNFSLRSKPTQGSRFYFDLCVSSYTQLLVCFPIAAGFLQSLLWIGVKNDVIEKSEGHMILAQLDRAAKQAHIPDHKLSAHVVDFDLAKTDKMSSSIKVLAEKIESMYIDGPNLKRKDTD